MITLVVPTLNSSRTVASCVASCVRQVGVEVQVIVVDNYSTDATREIAEELGALVLLAGPERSAQRNAGLFAAAGEYVIFIDSDMVIEPLVCLEVEDAFTSRASAAIVIPESSFGTGFWSGVRAFERTISEGVTDVEAARAFRTQQLRQMGGWNTDITAAEDWELSDRYLVAGHSMDRISGRVWHDEGRLTLSRAFSKKKYYGRDFFAYLARTPSRRIGMRRRYVRKTVAKEAMTHPVKAFGLAVLKVTELSGALAGRYSRHDSQPHSVYVDVKDRSAR